MTGMENSLNPTLWRTARALANRDRLNLLRLVAMAKGEKGVCDLAEEAGLPVPTASIYLRALNARGLISVSRAGSYVFYGTDSDRSLPVAIRIQKSFARLFSLKKLPADWADRLLPVLRAYSHVRRETLVRVLWKSQPVHYDEFRKRTGLGRTSFLRHLGILKSAGIVVQDAHGLYLLAKPENSLAAAFLDATCP